MKIHLRNFVLLLLMLASSGLAVALRPTHRIADKGPKLDLETMIPKRFGEWSIDENVVYQQVSPDTKAALDKIYTQALSRTYINQQGYRIMLSMPYGADQSDGLAAHDPEGCYPAQGFQILSKSRETLHTTMGDIPLRRMEASAGPRHEPVTYWVTVGNNAVNNDWDRKKAQLAFALNREIPDGLLVRVSSIDMDTNAAYIVQSNFIEELLKSLPPEARKRVSGLSS
jgi:EpsI family protein